MMTENKKMTALINCPNDRMFSSEIETSEYRIVFFQFRNRKNIFIFIQSGNNICLPFDSEGKTAYSIVDPPGLGQGVTRD